MISTVSLERLQERRRLCGSLVNLSYGQHDDCQPTQRKGSGAQSVTLTILPSSCAKSISPCPDRKTRHYLVLMDVQRIKSADFNTGSHGGISEGCAAECEAVDADETNYLF
jgi:hypothetical protein